MRRGERTGGFERMRRSYASGVRGYAYPVAKGGDLPTIERRLGQRRKTGRVRVPDVIVGRTHGGKGVSGQASGVNLV